MPALYPAFFFVLEKGPKSAGNAVIPTFPMHRSYGLQGSLKRRYKHPSLLPSMGTTRQKSSCRNGLQNGPRLLSRVKAGTHSPSPTGSHTRTHTPKQGCFGRGWYHYPRSVSHGSETLRGRVSERQTLPLFGLGRVCSRRTQKAFGTAMRLCASLSRGVAAPLGCVIFFAFVEIVACTPCVQGFPRVRDEGGYHQLLVCSACC